MNLEMTVNKVLNMLFFIGFCVVLLLNLEALNNIVSESDNPAVPLLLLNARIAVWFTMIAFILKTGVGIFLQLNAEDTKEALENGKHEVIEGN